MPRVVKGYKETAKSSIVQAAIKVFAEKGYHGSTMEDVARKLGVSKAALYQYFKSKDDLLREIQSSSRQEIREELGKVFENRSLAEGAAALFETIFGKYWGESRMGFDMFSLATSDEKLRRILREDHDADLKLIEAFVDEQAEKRRVKLKMDKRIIARLITGISLEILLELILGYDKGVAKKTWVEAITTMIE